MPRDGEQIFRVPPVVNGEGFVQPDAFGKSAGKTQKESGFLRGLRDDSLFDSVAVADAYADAGSAEADTATFFVASAFIATALIITLRRSVSV